ncbi:hypothetical protein OF83DRAFT_784861 [Amylostereum chailletii]|nr:hypothetical protein OF83DRAFT_784861 [Amylostereum chailletii]
MALAKLRERMDPRTTFRGRYPTSSPLLDHDDTSKVSLRNLQRVAKEIGDRLEDDEFQAMNLSRTRTVGSAREYDGRHSGSGATPAARFPYPSLSILLYSYSLRRRLAHIVLKLCAYE